MGHPEISIFAKMVVAFAVIVYIVSIMAIVGDDKSEEGEKAERRNPWYYIVAAAVCFLIGWLLPE